MLTALSPMLLTGCAGGNRSGTAGGPEAADRGRATLTVQWPERSRLIPFAANSIRVEIKNSQGTTVGTQTLARPASGGSASATFNLLPVGNLTILATANPSTDGTGVAQARATAPLVIQAGQTTPFGLTLASTIERIEVNPSTALNLTVGATQTVTATPKDAQGNTVLTQPQTIQWSSGNNAVATVNGSQVSAVAAGTTQITCRETESNRTASITVNVAPLPISWWKADGTPLDAMGRNDATAVGQVSYANGVSGLAFDLTGASSLNIPDSDDLKFTGSFTMDMWAFPRSFPNGVDPNPVAFLYFRGDWRQGADPYLIYLLKDGKLRFSIWQSLTLADYVETIIPLLQWSHITATFDGSTGTMALYINGQLRALHTTLLRPLRDLDPNFGPGASIGNHSFYPNYPDGDYWQYGFNGLIDEVKLYDRVVPPQP